jgi:hypothetical protein
MATSILKIKQLIAAALLLCVSLPALAQEGGGEGIWFPQGTNPAGETFAQHIDLTAATSDDPAAVLRTGIKKGIRGTTLDAELFAGPDAAVLRSGFFEPWPALLSALREPAVLVNSTDIAGLEKTKPFLIIPSGGLLGHAGSDFFKASLATYVRSGGVIVVFAQQNGGDLAALPIPDGSKTALAGAGWAQDNGPLFRASSIQSPHPMLSGTRKSMPDIETSGYLTSWPEKAQIVLSRPDGYPTLIVYPVGAGWVVITTLFTDYSFGQGRLEQDEKVLLQDLVAWAKAPEETLQAVAGQQLNVTLLIHGPAQGDASAVRISIVGPGKTSNPDQIVKLPAMQGKTLTLPFSFTIPADLPPGNYHLEYVLLDEAGRAVTTAAEADSGRFSLGQPTVAGPLQKQKLPLLPFTLAFRVEPLRELTAGGLSATVTIAADDTTGIAQNQDFFMRMAGQEKAFRLTGDKAELTFDLSAVDFAAPVAYTIYHSSGRSLARGSIPAGASAKTLTFDHAVARAGQKIKALFSGLGRGELTLTGAGILATQIVVDTGTFDIALPKDLPTGIYPVRWSLQKLDGNSRDGEESLSVSGYTVTIQDAIVRKRADPGTSGLIAMLRVNASARRAVTAKLLLRGPDGKTRPAIESPVTLTTGLQEVLLPITTRIDQAGIWELLYSLSTSLPEGPGLPSEPVSVASGAARFDAGNAAVLGITTDQPLYYEPSGTVAASVYVYGAGKANVGLFLDNKQIQKNGIELAGAAVQVIPVPGITAGTHALKATLDSDPLESVRERTIIYGAHLPDLTVTIQAPKPAGAVLPVGIAVRNEGKSTAGPSHLALYDGNPAAGGMLIEQVDIHKLIPGEQQAVLIHWPLYNKNGTRTLYALANSDQAVTEANAGNNSATAEVVVPDLLLGISPAKSSFGSDEDIAVVLTSVNLTSAPYKDLAITLQLVNQAGKAVHRDEIRINELSPGKEQRIDRAFRPGALPVGTYKLMAQLSRETLLASRTTDISVLPTLAVLGTLDNTPETATQCRPFTIQYKAASAGNIPVSTGTIGIEIRGISAAEPLFIRQLPFTEKTATLTIDSVELSQGTYTVQFKAAVANQSLKTSRELLLAERPLVVKGPLTVLRSSSPFPRVLVWQGTADSTLQRALSEVVMKQAFEQEGYYIKIVGNAADFAAEAQSNLFNIYVLFEINESLPPSDWLKEKLHKGQGLVLIGSDDGIRTTAETFGFTLKNGRTDENNALLTVAREAEFGLSGTIPVTGPVLEAQKKGVRAAATLSSTGQPAILIDRSEGGTIMLAPFSFVRSSRNAGAIPLYSLLLRSTVLHALPVNDSGDTIPRETALSSSSGPVRARIVETLPPGAKLLWKNPASRFENNALVLETTVDQEHQSLQYLFAPNGSGKNQPTTEVFYECNGKFMSQGKME